ncbi:hypothetical protein [Staphylococcus auricularis]|uniref:hypothetical protein n=1 Tax=Staphylococcus auricularis TaxID=29379 RepID=UPI00130086DF|nr:hypothetical protein [Staphylococcus auricularis]MCE5038833.1 hypothetical protein [Staphylococcus auricularis]MEB6570635.1 hypothetical protein [Staphylococcus auricularis]
MITKLDILFIVFLLINVIFLFAFSETMGEKIIEAAVLVIITGIYIYFKITERE